MLNLLKTLVTVNVATGEITPLPGVASSRLINTGYKYIRLNGTLYAQHHIVIAFKENRWLNIGNSSVNEIVDHINGNKEDNRGDNLRICNRSDNSCNRRMRSDNTLGYKGVFTRKRKSGTLVYGWMIKAKGANESKSGFPTAEAAFKDRQRVLRVAHGEFANDGT